MQQNENMERYRRLMADDDEIIALRSSVRKAAESKLAHGDEIIALRSSVRKAAESKLAHGIIDVNDLLKEINAENSAQVQKSIHEIEMLKEMYNLKITTNN